MMNDDIINDFENSDFHGYLVPVVPDYLSDMETSGSDEAEENTEELSRDGEYDTSGENETEQTVDYSDILLSIDGRLETLETSYENIETSLTNIENNTGFLNDMSPHLTFIAGSVVCAFIFVACVLAYKFFDFFIH